MKMRDVAIGANVSMFHRIDFRKIKGVYYPRIEEDVVGAIAHARRNQLSVTPKGGGSGFSAGCTGGNDERIMISSLQMKEILEVSKEQRYIDVQPGITPDMINKSIEPMGMRFCVTPSSRDIATVGGIMSTDGGGNDSWVYGTMRDNTIHVKMVLYDGHKVTVDWNGVKCDDSRFEDQLNDKNVTIHDVAGSHGTMGFITELRLAIKPEDDEPLIGAIVEFNSQNALGKSVSNMIEAKCPVKYSEAIMMIHEDIREGINPPLILMQYPKDFDMETFEPDVRRLDNNELERLKDYRLKLARRNPKKGVMVALFEDYGIHGNSLAEVQRVVDEIDSLVIRYGYEPFAKYGHAPSKWYLGDNSATYGLLMHCYEIKPEGKTSQETYQAVQEIVKLCDDLGMTPKPEHKWMYSDEIKKKRIEEIRKIIGDGFNPFIFESDGASTTLSSML